MNPTNTPQRYAASNTLLDALNDALFAQGLGHAGASRRQQRLEDAVDAVAMLHRGHREDHLLSIDLRRQPIQIDGIELPAASLRAGRLRRLAEERGVATITLAARTDVGQLGIALDLLGESRPGALADDVGAWTDLHCRYGLQAVRLVSTLEPGASPNRARRDTLDELQDLASQVEDNHLAAVQGDELGLDETRSVVERAAAALEERPSELLGLAHYDDIDRFTVGHSVRVALLAMHTAGAAGFDHDRLQQVGTAALLHDIGKSLVPAHVLFKRGKLEPEEWAAMMEHPRLGAQILVAQPHIDDCVVGAAFCHHMRPDGAGYPKALMPFRPGSVSGLVRICDVFEALTAVRPYKHGMAPAEALAIMHRDPGEFDQAWLRHFARTIGPFPVGSAVELSDGSVARVVDLDVRAEDGSRAWDRPRVVLEDGRELDLAANGLRVLRPALPGAQMAAV